MHVGVGVLDDPCREAAVRDDFRKMLRIFRRDVEDAVPYNYAVSFVRTLALKSPKDTGSAGRLPQFSIILHYAFLILHSPSRKKSPDLAVGGSVVNSDEWDYSWGPAATRALPSSLPVYLAKFLMKRADRSLAFSSQTEASA